MYKTHHQKAETDKTICRKGRRKRSVKNLSAK